METVLLLAFISLFVTVPALALASLFKSVVAPPSAPTPEDRVLDRRL